MIERKIQKDIQSAIEALQASNDWFTFPMPPIHVEIPQQKGHGDFSSNIGMQLAKVLKKNPLEIANDIKGELLKQEAHYEQLQIAHPGFLNFFVSNEQLVETVEHILDQGKRYGQTDMGHGSKVLIEFISANPTGPLTLPNGRGGYLGDVLANVYDDLGYSVVREYYVNDRGRQIDILGESVARRYLQKMGINVPFDDELYQGDYIKDLAAQLELKDYKLTNLKKIEWVKDRIKKVALQLMLKEIQRVVTEKMQIRYDSWFSEKSMYDQGLPSMVMDKLREKDVIYEDDGAVWIRTSRFGDDKDRVAIKSSGEGAYMQSDVALFYDRAFTRKVEKVILILGADHHGYEKRMKAIPKMFESQTDFDIIFTQMATLMKDGEEVRMSKRKGNFVTIEELIDEVGNDVARFFFLLYSSDRHMNFDLGLAKEHSDQNPVYYVQYAYARICSVLAEAGKIGEPALTQFTFTEDAEKELIKQLTRLTGLMQTIAQTYEVHHLTTYAMDIARAFHHFYSHCRVINNGKVNGSRFALILATQIVLRKTLRLLGVNAPEKM